MDVTVHKYSQPLLNTLLKHLWQQLMPQVFLNMMPQAWHTDLWAVLPIPLCSTSQAPSGWMGSVGAQPFSDLCRYVQSDSSLGSGWGSGWATHRVVLKPLLWKLGCVLRVVVLLKDELSPQSEVKSALEQVFIQDVSVHCCIHLSLYPD